MEKHRRKIHIREKEEFCDVLKVIIQRSGQSRIFMKLENRIETQTWHGVDKIDRVLCQAESPIHAFSDLGFCNMIRGTC